ncbi:MAG: hypothetical protein PHY16_12985 [Methylobacter sp.]|nr:hypothetical protein [Methylobacter sp.]
MCCAVLPMLANPDAQSLMALAAGSTIAGNLLILGAARNVIIIQHAEKHSVTLGFLNLLLSEFYWAFLIC